MLSPNEILERFNLASGGQVLPVADVQHLSLAINDSGIDLEYREITLKALGAHVNNSQSIPDVILNALAVAMTNRNNNQDLRKKAAYVCMKSLDYKADVEQANPQTERLVFYLEDAAKDPVIARYAALALHHILSKNKGYGLADDVFTALSQLLNDPFYNPEIRVRVLEVMTYALRNKQGVFSKAVLDAIERVFHENNSTLTMACLNALLSHVQHLSDLKTLPQKLMKHVVNALNTRETASAALELLKAITTSENEKEALQAQKIIDDYEATPSSLSSQAPFSTTSSDLDENDDFENALEHNMSDAQPPSEPQSPVATAAMAAMDHCLSEKSLGQLLSELRSDNQTNPAILQLLNDSSIQRQIEAVSACYQKASTLESVDHSLDPADNPANKSLGRDVGREGHNLNSQQTLIKTASVITNNPINEWDASDCARWADELKKQPNKARDPAFMAEMIAVVSRGNELTNTNQPRTAQVLALLLLLNAKDKGRLAQIATGEGKTTIVAMLAAIKVLQGEQVDVVTSTPILASRDAEERKAFFNLFNITVADNGEEKLTPGTKSCYAADIVYGDVAHFQWDLLSTEYQLEKTRINRPYSTVIVDEVDSMLLDEATKNALLGGQKPAMDHLIPLLSATRTKLALLNTPEHFQEDNGRLFFQYDDYSEKIEVTSRAECLTDVLEAYLKALIDEKDVDGNNAPIQIPAHLKAFALSQAKLWAQSAVTARFKLTEDKDYVMPSDDEGHFTIAPVDYQNTGVTLTKSSWNNGLHQFLQMKHGLEVTSESVTSSYISNIGYFNRYGTNIYGLTGTLGGEDSQALLQQTYPIDFVFIPTYKTKQLIEKTPLLVETPDAWIEAIIRDVQQAIHEKRAALVICESIHAAKELEARLKDAGIKRVIPYSRSDNQEKTAVSEELEAGDVIVATALAGRGTDIKTSAEVEKNGGLHVCLTYLPNKRGRDQAFGRTARQGHKGSAQLIVNKIDAESQLKHRYFMLGNADSIENLIQWRDAAESDRLSEIQSTEIEKINMQDALFARFCQLRKALHDKQNDPERLAELDEQWGFWLKTLENKITEERTFDEDAVFDAFEQFKQQAIQDYDTHQIRNPSHWVKKGNRYALHEKEDRQHAIAAYTKAAQLDPAFAVQALYNRAEVIIRDQEPDYKEKAIQDLREAKSLICEKLIPPLEATPVIEGLAREASVGHHSARSKQIQNKLTLLNREVQYIDAAIENIANSPGDVRIGQIKGLNHGFDDENNPASEIDDLRQMGLQHFFEVEAVPEEDDDDDDWFGMLCVAVLGVMQIVVSVAVALSGNIYLGAALFFEGLGDLFYAVNSAMTGHFKWDEYKNNKIISLGTTALTWGKTSIQNALGKVTTKKLGEEALKQEVKKQFAKALTQKCIHEIANLGLDAVSRHAMAQFKVDIENNVREELLTQLNEPSFNAIIDKFLSIDAHHQNEAFTQQLTQLASHIIYPKQNKINGITSAILKGTLANQHRGIAALIKLADISDAAFKLSDLCDQFCQEFKARVRFMDHKLTTAQVEPVDFTQDRTAAREKLYQSLIGIVSHCVKHRLHTHITRPAAGMLMDKHINAFSDKVQGVVERAHFAKRDFLKEQAALQNLHMPETIQPLLNRNCSDLALEPTFRGLSAESRNSATLLDPADKPRDVGYVGSVALNQSANPQPEASYLNSVLALRSPADTEMMNAMKRTLAKSHQDKITYRQITQAAPLGAFSPKRGLFNLEPLPYSDILDRPAKAATLWDVAIGLSQTGKDLIKAAVSPVIFVWDAGIMTVAHPNPFLAQTSTYQNARHRMSERASAAKSAAIFAWDIAILSNPNEAFVISKAQATARDEEMWNVSGYGRSYRRMLKRVHSVKQGIEYVGALPEPDKVQLGTRIAGHLAFLAMMGNSNYSQSGPTHPGIKNYPYNFKTEKGTIFDAVHLDGHWYLDGCQPKPPRQITNHDLKPAHFKKQPVETPNLPSNATGFITISENSYQLRNTWVKQEQTNPSMISATIAQPHVHDTNRHKKIKMMYNGHSAKGAMQISWVSSDPLNMLYRGDSRKQTEIFQNGFTARGKNMDLQQHAYPLTTDYFTNDSGYVACAKNTEAATSFAGARGFVYMISPQKNAIDVNMAIKEGRWTEAEKEMAVPHHIPAKDIKGAWPVEGLFRLKLGEFIPNPNHIPSVAESSLTLKITEYGTTVSDSVTLPFQIQSHSNVAYHQNTTLRSSFHTSGGVSYTRPTSPLPLFPCSLTRIGRDYSHYLPVERLSITDIQHLEFKDGIEILNFIITADSKLIYARSIDGHNHDRLGNGKPIAGGGEIHLSRNTSGDIQMDYFNNGTGAYWKHCPPEKSRHFPDFFTRILETEGFDGKKGPSCKGKFQFFKPEPIVPMTLAKEEYLAWEKKQRLDRRYTASNRQWTDEAWLASPERKMAIAQGILPLKTEAEVSRELWDILESSENKIEALRKASDLFSLQPRRFSTAAVNSLAKEACSEKQWEFFIHLYCTEKLDINAITMAIEKAAQDQRWYVVTLLLENHASELSMDILRKIYNAADSNQQLHITDFLVTTFEQREIISSQYSRVTPDTDFPRLVRGIQGVRSPVERHLEKIASRQALIGLSRVVHIDDILDDSLSAARNLNNPIPIDEKIRRFFQRLEKVEISSLQIMQGQHPQYLKKAAGAFLFLSLSMKSAESAEIKRCQRPDYEDVKEAYKTVDGYGNFSLIGNIIGGQVHANFENHVFHHACAIRASYALFNAPPVRNKTKCNIPSMHAGDRVETVSGRDRLQYIFRLSTLVPFLERVYGPPDYDSRRRHNPAQLKKNLDKPGVLITLFSNTSSISGHAEIIEHFDTTNGYGAQVFWALPSHIKKPVYNQKRDREMVTEYQESRGHYDYYDSPEGLYALEQRRNIPEEIAFDSAHAAVLGVKNGIFHIVESLISFRYVDEGKYAIKKITRPSGSKDTQRQFQLLTEFLLMIGMIGSATRAGVYAANAAQNAYHHFQMFGTFRALRSPCQREIISSRYSRVTSNGDFSRLVDTVGKNDDLSHSRRILDNEWSHLQKTAFEIREDGHFYKACYNAVQYFNENPNEVKLRQAAPYSDIEYSFIKIDDKIYVMPVGEPLGSGAQGWVRFGICIKPFVESPSNLYAIKRTDGDSKYTQEFELSKQYGLLKGGPLQIPNGAGIYGDEYYCVYPYLGKTLENWLDARRRELVAQERLDIAIKLCLKVHELHEVYHIEHNDLQHFNITVDQEGEVHLIDLGAAKAITDLVNGADINCVKHNLQRIFTNSLCKPFGILSELHSSPPQFLMDMLKVKYDHKEDTPLKIAAHLIGIRENIPLRKPLTASEQREILTYETPPKPESAAAAAADETRTNLTIEIPIQASAHQHLKQTSPMAEIKHSLLFFQPPHTPSAKIDEALLERIQRHLEKNRPLPGLEELANPEEPFGPSSLSGAKPWTLAERIAKAGLPATGAYRYILTEGKHYNPNMPLPRYQRRGGYIDDFKNIWKKGASRTLGDPIEWDVELSPEGIAYFKSKSVPIHNIGKGAYVNISLLGNITH